MSNSQPAVDLRRPRALHISRSFTRLESPNPSPASPSRIRASTIHTIPEARDIAELEAAHAKNGDIFESVDEHDDHLDSPLPAETKTEPESPATFDQLPIEIRSLTERLLFSSHRFSRLYSSDSHSQVSQIALHQSPCSPSEHRRHCGSVPGLLPPGRITYCYPHSLTVYPYNPRKFTCLLGHFQDRRHHRKEASQLIRRPD